MTPRIETLPETRLIGVKVRMSFANNKTGMLWQTLMPRRREIENGSADLYSVEVYDDTNFFSNFNPTTEFEKWAAVAVSEQSPIPENMEELIMPEGLYAVFHYKGKASDAAGTYQYIYGTWLPQSEYELDDRPHFALMGEKYKNEDPDSEEELWVPIKEK